MYIYELRALQNASTAKFHRSMMILWMIFLLQIMPGASEPRTHELRHWNLWTQHWLGPWGNLCSEEAKLYTECGTWIVDTKVYCPFSPGSPCLFGSPLLILSTHRWVCMCGYVCTHNGSVGAFPSLSVCMWCSPSPPSEWLSFIVSFCLSVWLSVCLTVFVCLSCVVSLVIITIILTDAGSCGPESCGPQLLVTVFPYMWLCDLSLQHVRTWSSVCMVTLQTILLSLSVCVWLVVSVYWSLSASVCC
jgi:hypothetical protein